MTGWTNRLPAVGPFAPTVPVEAAWYLSQCLRSFPRSSAQALQAAALVQCWRESLREQGHPLDPYPGLTGDGYLWSALKLVTLANDGPRGQDSGLWNVLRRAEANLRAWWLEQPRGGEDR